MCLVKHKNYSLFYVPSQTMLINKNKMSPLVTIVFLKKRKYDKKKSCN